MTTDTAERDRQIIAEQARENLALRRELAELRARCEALGMWQEVVIGHLMIAGKLRPDYYESPRATVDDLINWARSTALRTDDEARNGHKDCTVPEYLAVGTVLPGCDPQPVIAEGGWGVNLEQYIASLPEHEQRAIEAEFQMLRSGGWRDIESAPTGQ